VEALSVDETKLTHSQIFRRDRSGTSAHYIRGEGPSTSISLLLFSFHWIWKRRDCGDNFCGKKK